MKIKSELAGRTELWANSDRQDCYKPIHKDGSVNQYGIRDIEYRYNDFGYRCDNFNDHNVIPIVYLGCSLTEGIGLPIESTWGYLLTERIRVVTNKKIPFWSLAQAARGIDNQANLLYEFTRTHPIKYVFCLFPPPGRREYVCGSSNIHAWLPESGKIYGPAISHLFSDPNYIRHEDRKHWIILDLIRAEQKAQIFTTSWQHKEFDPNPIVDEFDQIISFNNMNNPGRPLDYARDGIHPGKSYHLNIAIEYWEKIKHLF